MTEIFVQRGDIKVPIRTLTIYDDDEDGNRLHLEAEASNGRLIHIYLKRGEY